MSIDSFTNYSIAYRVKAWVLLQTKSYVDIIVSNSSSKSLTSNNVFMILHRVLIFLKSVRSDMLFAGADPGISGGGMTWTRKK
jgi:hypothetical protein